ncbi:LuxR family transcriptional regulator [Streptomyces sp. NPDC093109]|uniref:helix-turn-helix transcriptional regulator n=1 Tax=Streptomyces sp. NPDC093109 TaxID=3154977 RepID=UPI003450F9AB
MRRYRPLLVGRNAETEEVAEALRSTGASAYSLLVTGGAGAGKTAVVERARRVVVDEGVKVLRLGWEDAEGQAGTAVLADAVCGVLAKLNDVRIPARVAAVRRVQSRTSDGGGEVALLSALGEALADAAHYVPFALVLDDVQRLSAQTAAALGLLLRGFRPAGVPVVMAGRPTGPGHTGARLPAAADRVLELPPLPPADAGALIVQRLGGPAEPFLVTAVLRSLGPLAGNPAGVLSVLGSLEERGALLDIDGQVCLAEPEGRLRLTADAMELGIGRPDASLDTDAVVTAAAIARLVDAAELRLDDLHRLELPGGTPEAFGRTVDRLVRDGVLTVDREGRMAFAVPAFAAALRTLSPQGDVRSLHARVITTVTDRLGAAAAGASYPRLADHVAAAGSMVDDALTVPLLLAAAGSGRADPPRAVRGHLAVLRRLPRDDSRTPGLLRESADVSLRCADHTGVLALGEPLLACLERPRGEDREGLEWVTRAYALSALHEHRSLYAEDADPRYRKALERIPDAAELAALGGLYGIGLTTTTPSRRGSGSDRLPAAGRTSGSGPVPSPAEVRLLAAAAGSGAEFARARRSLPEDALGQAALDRVRTAAGYGDLAGAFEAVLGERYVAEGDSIAVRYRAMVRDYLAGNWDSALSGARRIEARGRIEGMTDTGQLARALAAEIHTSRGEAGRVRKWLDLIPDSVVHPLVARVRLSDRYWSWRTDEAFEAAWCDVRRARESGVLAGIEGVLQRILWFGVRENMPAVTRRALEELEALHEEVASPMTHEAVLLARCLVHRDTDSTLVVHRLVRQQGDLPLRITCCLYLAEISDDPQPWLAESTRILHSLGVGRSLGRLLSPAARERNGSMPRHRAARERLSEQDLRLIERVSAGSTNRQIAAGLAWSEKTVEQRLTQLFQRTGCRSRTELATAWLDGRLAELGLVPDTGADGGSGDAVALGPGRG